MADKKFTLPKYKKGQTVSCGDVSGTIDRIENTTAGIMYEVCGQYYLECEIDHFNSGSPAESPSPTATLS